jgi:hypothetical protein
MQGEAFVALRPATLRRNKLGRFGRQPAAEV